MQRKDHQMTVSQCLKMLKLHVKKNLISLFWLIALSRSGLFNVKMYARLFFYLKLRILTYKILEIIWTEVGH